MLGDRMTCFLPQAPAWRVRVIRSKCGGEQATWRNRILAPMTPRKRGLYLTSYGAPYMPSFSRRDIISLSPPSSIVTFTPSTTHRSLFGTCKRWTTVPYVFLPTLGAISLLPIPPSSNSSNPPLDVRTKTPLPSAPTAERSSQMYSHSPYRKSWLRRTYRVTTLSMHRCQYTRT